MDYLKEAANELRNHSDLKQAVENLKEEIEYINSQLMNVKGQNLEDVPGGGSVNADDRICNLIFKKQIKEAAYNDTLKALEITESVLKKLDIDGRLLERAFIDNAPPWVLEDEFQYSNRQLHRKRKAALKRFAIHKFGIKSIA